MTNTELHAFCTAAQQCAHEMLRQAAIIMMRMPRSSLPPSHVRTLTSLTTLLAHIKQEMTLEILELHDLDLPDGHPEVAARVDRIHEGLAACIPDLQSTLEVLARSSTQDMTLAATYQLVMTAAEPILRQQSNVERAWMVCRHAPGRAAEA